MEIKKMYQQRDIIEYNVKLNDGRLLPVRGIILTECDRHTHQITVGRISKEMSVYNPVHHFLLKDDMVVRPLEEECYLTSGFVELEFPEERITRRMNILHEDIFEKYLVWLTGLVGHNFLWRVKPY